MHQPIYYTYYIKHLKTGLQYYGVKYGKNSDPNKFWVPNGYFTSSKIIKAMVKDQGMSAFHAEVRKTFTDKKEAVEYEQRFLRKVNAPFSHLWLNQAYGTGPYLDKFGMRNTNKGVPKSEEHRRKISESHKGKKHPRTAAWTAKIAAANIGRAPTNKGVPHTDEARKKMSKKRKGMIPNNANKNILYDGREITMKEAMRFLDINQYSVRMKVLDTSNEVLKPLPNRETFIQDELSKMLLKYPIVPERNTLIKELDIKSKKDICNEYGINFAILQYFVRLYGI